MRELGSNVFYRKTKTCVPANNLESDGSSSSDDEAPAARREGPRKGIEMIVSTDRDIFGNDFDSDSSESRWPRRNVPESDLVIPETDRESSSSSPSPSPAKPEPSKPKPSIPQPSVAVRKQRQTKKCVITSDRYQSTSAVSNLKPRVAKVVTNPRRCLFSATGLSSKLKVLSPKRNNVLQSKRGSVVPSKRGPVSPSKRSKAILHSAVSGKENEAQRNTGQLPIQNATGGDSKFETCKSYCKDDQLQKRTLSSKDVLRDVSFNSKQNTPLPMIKGGTRAASTPLLANGIVESPGLSPVPQLPVQFGGDKAELAENPLLAATPASSIQSDAYITALASAPEDSGMSTPVKQGTKQTGERTGTFIRNASSECAVLATPSPPFMPTSNSSAENVTIDEPDDFFDLPEESFDENGNCRSAASSDKEKDWNAPAVESTDQQNNVGRPASPLHPSPPAKENDLKEPSIESAPPEHHSDEILENSLHSNDSDLPLSVVKTNMKNQRVPKASTESEVPATPLNTTKKKNVATGANAEGQEIGKRSSGVTPSTSNTLKKNKQQGVAKASTESEVPATPFNTTKKKNVATGANAEGQEIGKRSSGVTPSTSNTLKKNKTGVNAKQQGVAKASTGSEVPAPPPNIPCRQQNKRQAKQVSHEDFATSASDPESSASDTESPASGTESPASDTESPASDAESPASNADSSSYDSDIYVNEEWRRGDIIEIPFSEEEYFTKPTELKSPAEYFNFYFDDELLDLIVNETNLYSFQKNGKCLNITRKELKTFLGILIYFGVCKLPSMRDYWALKTLVKQVSDVMPRNRYQAIHRLIHFHNNEEIGEDRLIKVRPILDHIRRKCKEVEKEIKLSVDERMQGYKGKRAGNLRQYLPAKPSHKWGFKIFVLAGKCGMTYDFIVYTGADTFCNESLTEEEEEMGVGASAVISLCKSIARPEVTTVTFDNWYTGVPLIAYLRDNFNLHSMGTIQRNRFGNTSPLTPKKAMENKKRGTFESFVSKEDVAVVQWVDNKPVCLASSFAGVEPLTAVKRYSKEEQAKVDVPCPRVVALYNASMGGVDLADMYMALYSIPTRSKRWYFSLFGYCVEVALTNAYLQYQRDAELLGLTPDIKNSKDFRLAVSDTLRNDGARARGRPSLNHSLTKRRMRRPMALRPNSDFRLDNINHWPETASKGRCKYCAKGFSRVKCTKCNMSLCLVPNRNCFVQFHTDKNLPVEIARKQSSKNKQGLHADEVHDEVDQVNDEDDEEDEEDDEENIDNPDETGDE